MAARQPQQSKKGQESKKKNQYFGFFQKLKSKNRMFVLVQRVKKT
jgi:hypothetical protein